MEVIRSVIILTVLFTGCSIIPPIEGRLEISRYKGTLDTEESMGLLGRESKKSAHLLVQKRFRNSFIVEGLDLIVEYSIFNVGSLAANHVHLKDPALEDNTHFVRVSGFTDVTFGKILAGGNATHVIIVRPLIPGNFNISGAQITYSPGEGEDQIRGTSSEPGSVLVHSSMTYHRLFSPHYEEWSAFAFGCLPSLIIPYMLWFSSQSKYESLVMLRDADKMRRSARSRRD